MRDVTKATATATVLIVLTGAGCGGAPVFDGDRAYDDLVTQCSFGPRCPGSPGHDATRDWLVEQMRATADDVKVQRFSYTSSGEKFEFANIVASYRPEVRDRVLLAAHWDTRSVAERDPDPSRREDAITGANDGASGVAVLLELGRLIKERPPDVGVDMVLFDAEDGGDEGGLGSWCIGSSYYAEHLGAYCPRFAVVVDMIGDCDLEIPIEPYSRSAAPELVTLIWAAAERVGATSFCERTGTAIYDDHVPLAQAGLAAIDLIDLDYPYWHTVEDTPDKCCPRSLAEVGQVLAEFLYSL
jgi:glutaminyl-peptide cyclotransferase